MWSQTKAYRQKTVCVVDDEDSVRSYLSDVLTSGGYACVAFSNGAAACRWMATGGESVDLLLSDVSMPGMTGIDLLRIAKAVNPDLPFIMLSGGWDLQAAQSAVRAGATDCLAKPCSPEDLIAMVSRHTAGEALDAEKYETIRGELKLAFGKGNESGSDHAAPFLRVFDILGIKRHETLQHSRRVAASALLIGRKLGLDSDSLRALEVGSLLHDIGKTAIPHNILMKPGQLNDKDWEIMKMHPGLGLDLLSGLAGYEREKQVVYSHHENFDGKGYPQQLTGESIPLFARVFAIADTLDAVTTNRCYRPAQSFAAARDEIQLATGCRFDPAIVKIFEQVSNEEFELVNRQFPDLP